MSARGRTPIEVAIDAACGLAGIPDGMKLEPYVEEPVDYVLAFQSVVEAAMRWNDSPSEQREFALQHACNRLKELESK